MDNYYLKKIYENQVLIMKMLMSVMNPSNSDEPSYVVAFNASRAIENTENIIKML